MIRALTTGILAVAIASCGARGMPVHTISVGSHQVQVEIAANGTDRAQGLMHRDAMPAEEGMLFIYPDEAPRSFWMKNTRIPLSIAFADNTGKIVRIADMAPFDTDRTQSLYPARYALEMNLGWFETNAVKPGDKLGNLPEVEVR